MKYFLLIASLICSIASHGMNDRANSSEMNDHKKHDDITIIFPWIEESLNKNFTDQNNITDPLIVALREKDKEGKCLFYALQVTSVLSQQLQPMIQVSVEKSYAADGIGFENKLKPLLEKSSCNEYAIKYGFGEKSYYESKARVVFSFYKKCPQEKFEWLKDQNNSMIIYQKKILKRLHEAKMFIKNDISSNENFSKFQNSKLENRSDIFVQPSDNQGNVEICYVGEKYSSFVNTSFVTAVKEIFPVGNFQYANFEFERNVEETATSLVIKAILVKDLEYQTRI